MKQRFLSFFPYLLFLLVTVAIFNPYFFLGKVPFPGNLLVSYFQPWKSYSWAGYPSGPPNKPIGFDSLRIFYPYRVMTTEQLKEGKLPLWNPYTFSGNMYLAAYQTAVFHPIGILFFLLPSLDAWSVMVILSPLLTAIFMYLFLRSLQLSEKASILGALAFGFSGIVVAFTEEWYIASYSITVLPLVFLGIYKLYQKISIRYIVVLTLSLCFSILSGWFQMTFYTYVFSFFWILFLLWSKRSTWILYVFISYIFSFLLSSAHLIPNIESYLYSARATTDAKYIFDLYLLPYYHVITYLVPDFWGNPATYSYFGGGFYQEKILTVGIVGFFFAIYASLRKKQISSVNTFFIISWLITLSLGLSLPPSWFVLYYLHIPLLSTLVPSRIFIVAAFAISVVCAFGIDAFFNERNGVRTFITSLLVGILLLLGWRVALWDHRNLPQSLFATVTYKNLFLPTIITALVIGSTSLYIFWGKKLSKIVTISLLGISILSITYFSLKYLYFSERKFTFPQVPVLTELQKLQGYDRSWSYGDGYIEANLTAYYHLYSVEGYDSFFIERYGDLLNSTKTHGKTSSNIPRSDALLPNIQNLREFINNPYQMRFLSLLGVKYIAGRANQKDNLAVQTDLSDLFRPVWSDGIYSIFEYKVTFPRVFLVDRYTIRQGRQPILDYLYNPKTDLFTDVILEEKPRFTTNATQLSGNAHIVSYQSGTVTIESAANKTALLLLSDNYYPGWKAYVDGKETKIYRADYTLRSIVVPSGKHTITFTYKPVFVTWGIWVSVISAIVFVLFLMRLRYTKSKL